MNYKAGESLLRVVHINNRNLSRIQVRSGCTILILQRRSHGLFQHINTVSTLITTNSLDIFYVFYV